MYERQIHKDGIRRTVFGVEGESVQRYFKRNELKELFKLGEYVWSMSWLRLLLLMTNIHVLCPLLNKVLESVI